MSSNRLKLNADKAESMWFTIPTRQKLLPAVAICVGGYDDRPRLTDRPTRQAANPLTATDRKVLGCSVCRHFTGTKPDNYV
jgi:hypothetical protein